MSFFGKKANCQALRKNSGYYIANKQSRATCKQVARDLFSVKCIVKRKSLCYTDFVLCILANRKEDCAVSSKILNRLIGIATQKYTGEYFWKIRARAKSGGIRKYIYGFKYQRLVAKFNASIPLSANIEGPFSLPHGISGIFISSGAKIGKNCTIFHQVTIGSNTLQDSRGQGCPTIGDNVYIGCGAKIIGGVHIGNNVRIGANCVVVSDVPDNCTVVLERPRMIQKENTMQNKYIGLRDYEHTEKQL